MIHFSCSCGRELDLGESWVGQTVRCPDCDESMVVPYPPPGALGRSSRRCPDCDSTATARITSRRALRRMLPAGDPLAGDPDELNQAFVFRLPRLCHDCGAVWVPPLARGMGVFLVAVGALLLLFFLGLPIYLYFFATVRGPVEIVYVSGGVNLGALALMAYGLHVAAGRSARPRILRPGEPRD